MIQNNEEKFKCVNCGLSYSKEDYSDIDHICKNCEKSLYPMKTKPIINKEELLTEIEKEITLSKFGEYIGNIILNRVSNGIDNYINKKIRKK